MPQQPINNNIGIIRIGIFTPSIKIPYHIIERLTDNMCDLNIAQCMRPALCHNLGEYTAAGPETCACVQYSLNWLEKLLNYKIILYYYLLQ